MATCVGAADSVAASITGAVSVVMVMVVDNKCNVKDLLFCPSVGGGGHSSLSQ